MKFNVEYTDTFGGEANYCWVRRESIELPEGVSQSHIMRQAKRAVGINGLRGKTFAYGGNEAFEFRPHRVATVMFVTAEY